MNELTKVFNYQDKQIRTIIKDDQPWFVGTDVCMVLDIFDARQAIKRLDEDERCSTPVTDSLGRLQSTFCVNETGLYSLVLSSRKPEAKEFKRWITHEVIPQIRKTGFYSVQKNSAELIAAGYQAALQLIEDMKPKAKKFDELIDSSNYQAMEQAAKVLNIGRNTLFKLLRMYHIFTDWNLPGQSYMDRGYFTVKEYPMSINGEQKMYAQTFVSAKGINFLHDFLDKHRNDLEK